MQETINGKQMKAVGKQKLGDEVSRILIAGAILKESGLRGL